MQVTSQAYAEQSRSLAHPDDTDELADLRALCWRQTQEINALNDTVTVLRDGANRLAADNALMSAELAVRRPS